MKMSMSDALFAVSNGLDSIENEVTGATTNHAKRVAFMSVLIGRQMDLSDQALLDLSAAAVLHDSALTEYMQSELRRLSDPAAKMVPGSLGDHCRMGEKNVAMLPFYERMPKNTILYHHENYDGTGPFHVKGADIPCQAQIVHIADILDVTVNLREISDEKYARSRAFLQKQSGAMFSPELTELFLAAMDESMLTRMAGDSIDGSLQEVLPPSRMEYEDRDVARFATMFAHIIDYKSKFTATHSKGVARKSSEMAAYYGWDNHTRSQVFVAGALHDIGKLMVSRNLLEKPAALTGAEYERIKDHARFSYDILSRIKGFEDITPWACYHHEKLDGSGYPFGLTGDDLDKVERMIACIDIYQALTEDRPYRSGMNHASAMEIIRPMASAGSIDGDIVDDIDRVFKNQ